jgi:hypothetical protein
MLSIIRRLRHHSERGTFLSLLFFELVECYVECVVCHPSVASVIAVLHIGFVTSDF